MESAYRWSFTSYSTQGPVEIYFGVRQKPFYFTLIPYSMKPPPLLLLLSETSLTFLVHRGPSHE